MRELIITRIKEEAVFSDTLNAVLRVLGAPMVTEFNDEYFMLVLGRASDEDLLAAYDLLSTPSSEWGMMYGFEHKDCII